MNRQAPQGRFRSPGNGILRVWPGSRLLEALARPSGVLGPGRAAAFCRGFVRGVLIGTALVFGAAWVAFGAAVFPDEPSAAPIERQRRSCGAFEYYVDRYPGLTLVGRYVHAPDGAGYREKKGWARIAVVEDERDRTVYVRDFHQGERGPYVEVEVRAISELAGRGPCQILNPALGEGTGYIVPGEWARDATPAEVSG